MKKKKPPRKAAEVLKFSPIALAILSQYGLTRLKAPTSWAIYITSGGPTIHIGR